MSAEALLALGYAAFLLAAAIGLDLLARHSHTRSMRYRTAGFSFQPELDLWECPEGQQLHRVETDHRQRLARYRASPRICNACPAKADCTDSDRGREIVRPLDPWPHSEAGRFHRGIALLMVALAGARRRAGRARRAARAAPRSRSRMPPGNTKAPRWRGFRPVRQPVVTAARVRGLAWEHPAPLLRRGQLADRLLAHRA